MKKLITILFFLLINLVTLQGNINLWHAGYELAATTETDTESKESKKDISEFLLNTSKNHFNLSQHCNGFNLRSTFIFPGPLLHKPTPPPDKYC